MFCFEGIRTEKEGGDRAIERAHMCVRERLCGRGERASEGGRRISSTEDAHWECVAVQRAESEASRCTADRKQQVSSLEPESVNGQRHRRR